MFASIRSRKTAFPGREIADLFGVTSGKRGLARPEEELSRLAVQHDERQRRGGQPGELAVPGQAGQPLVVGVAGQLSAGKIDAG